MVARSVLLHNHYRTLRCLVAVARRLRASGRRLLVSVCGLLSPAWNRINGLIKQGVTRTTNHRLTPLCEHRVSLCYFADQSFLIKIHVDPLTTILRFLFDILVADVSRTSNRR